MNPYLAKLTVTRVTPLKGDSNIKAFASIRLGSVLQIHSIKIIQQTGQKAYVRLPDQKSQDGNGYFPIVSADDELFMEAVTEKVLAAWGDVVVTGKAMKPERVERF